MRSSFAILCVLAASSLACGSKKNTFMNGDDAGVEEEDGGDIGIDPMDAGDSGPSGCTMCSADLKHILSCGDPPTILQTCTGDQGCGPNGCVNACDAAAANKSSIGCDYYAIPADGWSTTYNSGGAAGNCFAAFVNNTWSTPMKVTLTWKGKSIDATPFSYIPKGQGANITYQPVPSSGIPASSMAIVFLNQTQGGSGYKVQCPNGTKAAIENEDVVIHATSISNAIGIKTSVPAIVYDIYPYGGALSYISSGTLLLPTTAWDTNYVAVTMERNIASYPGGIDFIAREDNTKVTVLPSVNIQGGMGVASATKGSPVTYSLNKGQTVHIMQLPQGNDDLSGSIVQSNNPIGVWGEHFCMVHSQPPKWRILGTVNGTNLKFDPPVPGAPTSLARGQLVEFDGPEAFYVKAQDDKHPFYLAAHRPGGDCDAAHQQIPPVQALGYEYVAVGNSPSNFNVGGPETVNVVPPAQFLTEYLFFTDPTYGWTDLSLVRGKAADNTYKDVSLDCSGKVTTWKPIGNSGYQYTFLEVQKNKSPVGNCTNGLHTIKSDGKFGITVWGYDSASSYAYPAGASVKPINTVVVPPTPN